ncbi:hypothetical protein L1077_21650 [Pseudoalteromonas luteoviolacea]|uniref:hypothetical protein n=1 Tax=Pseudoalteromonas luteoviolacea TaxID=43657 RepID=UPI001F3AE1EA|nr:hypothetical protein [Pseudoalteromonas luteoviolacea]MCF6442039.1 hypothetical protein [Pseudoalteromonas luteoviolacea]
MLSEKELEDFIFEAAEKDHEELSNRGLFMPDSPKFYRQVKLGDYGIADIIAIGRCKETDKLEVFIYELKKEKVSVRDLPQISMYMGGVYMWLRGQYSQEEYTMIGVLLAPSVDYENLLFGNVTDKVFFMEIKYEAFNGVRFIPHHYNGYAKNYCKSVDIEIPPPTDKKDEGKAEADESSEQTDKNEQDNAA